MYGDYSQRPSGEYTASAISPLLLNGQVHNDVLDDYSRSASAPIAPNLRPTRSQLPSTGLCSTDYAAPFMTGLPTTLNAVYI